ncbi:MAG: hypothetical protein ACM3QR_00455 [Syntrophothermus sp.]
METISHSINSTTLKSGLKIVEGDNIELHHLLSELDSKDFEKYLNACKEDLKDFLEDLGLNNTQTLQLLEDVRIFFG